MESLYFAGVGRAGCPGDSDKVLAREFDSPIPHCHLFRVRLMAKTLAFGSSYEGFDSSTRNHPCIAQPGWSAPFGTERSWVRIPLHGLRHAPTK